MAEINSTDGSTRNRLPGRRHLLVIVFAAVALLVAFNWWGTVREEIALARLSGMPGVKVASSQIGLEIDLSSFDGDSQDQLLAMVGEKHPNWLNWLFRLRLVSKPKFVRINAAAPQAAFVEVGSLQNVFHLDLSGSAVSDDSLADVVPRPFRGWLLLNDTAIGDAGLRRIAGCRLQLLDLTGTRVTDAGLASIATCRELKSLALTSTDVTGATLSELQRLPGLLNLDLSETLVTDRSLAGLSGHPGLGCINLSATRIGDEALAVLVTMPNCGLATLSDTQVTGTGLSHLAGRESWVLVQLSRCPLATAAVAASNLESQHLRLDETPLDDGIVPWLLSRSRLKSVRLDRSAITNRGLTALANPRRGFGFSLDDTAIDDAGVAAYYLGEGYSVPDSGDVEQRSLLITEIAAAHAAVPARIKLSAWSLRGTRVSPDVLSVLEPQ
jgi:hypothetical protein